MTDRPSSQKALLARTSHDRLIRFFDIALSALAFSFLWPLLCLIGLLIRLDSPGPVLFRQDRVGLGGRLFRIFKFRTMRPGEPYSIPRYKRNSQGRLEPVIKLKDDKRVTRVGYFLRKFSLDELLQLLNIIRGEMSLVGTRPPVPEEVDAYNDFQWGRLGGKPGLTGLAQINGRSEMEFDRIVEFDVYYIKNRTIWLYLKILILTVPYFLSGKASF